MQSKRFITKNTPETQDVARNLAKTVTKNRIIALYGDLGAGKTTFVQALAKELGIKKRVISPTFVIHRSYLGENFIFNHIDLYRLNSKKDVLEQGIMDLFENPQNIVAIEWAEKMEDLLPKDTIKVYLKYLGDNEREISIL